MITLERGRRLDSHSSPPKYQGILNGVPILGLQLTGVGPSGKPRLFADGPDARARMLECRLGEVGSAVESTSALLLVTDGEAREGFLGLGVGTDGSVELVGFFVLVWWNRSYTFEAYTEALEAELKPYGWVQRETNPRLGLSHGTHWRLRLAVSKAYNDRVLGDLFGQLAQDLQNSIGSVEAALRTQSSRAAVIEAFEFPEHLRGPCTQYLLYFVQFLRDLGIEATAEVKEEAHRVLFSVIPADGEEALQRVRDALAAYLVVPSSGDLSAVVASNPDIAMVQLQANVGFLQTQVQLAQALLQTKDATIEALSLSNYVYREQLSVDPLRGRQLPQAEAAADEPLEVAQGAVILTNFKANGITIRVPEILRWLRRRLPGRGR